MRLPTISAAASLWLVLLVSTLFSFSSSFRIKNSQKTAMMLLPEEEGHPHLLPRTKVKTIKRTTSKSGRRRTRSRIVNDAIGRLRGGNTSTESNINDNGAPSSPIGQQGPETTTVLPRPKLGMMTFSEKLLPNVRRLFAGTSEAYSIGWSAVKQSIHAGDLIILAVMSFLSIPIMKVCHQLYYQTATKLVPTNEAKEYEESKFSKTGKLLSQGGKIASLVYLVELITTFSLNVMILSAPKPQLPQLPKHLVPLQKFPGLFANCIYGYWIANHIVEVKSRIFETLYEKLPDSDIYDRIMSYLIYVTATILIIDASQFDFTALVKSLVAVGGLSSIVIGLALKEPISQLIQGMFLVATNKFRRNELIRLADGTQGKVVDINLLETTIMGGDNIQYRIPHSKISGQKFANLSRMQRSQTKFQIRLNLYDMPRIKEIIDAIRNEIIMTCSPQLVTDGSRPFRVIWTDIGEDHIVVTIDASHDVKPLTNDYWEAREKVLLAISRATQNTNTKLAMPIQVNARFQNQELPSHLQEGAKI